MHGICVENAGFGGAVCLVELHASGKETTEKERVGGGEGAATGGE